MPRMSHIDIADVMSYRITHQHLPSATPRQRQLIDAGSNVDRASCPFNHHRWSQLLVDYVEQDTCYNADVLIAGIQYGSLVRYEGNRQDVPHVRNHDEARNRPDETLALILQEVSLGRMLGPFDPSHPPFPHIKISPINTVAKGADKWRLIHDLSSPHKRSVNDGICKMPTQWQLIEHALQLIVNRGTGCHLVKMDVKSAYRNLTVHPSDWSLFGIMIEKLLFIDTCMAFGSSSSGNIWERYAQAIQWMLHNKYSIPPSARWVDDFLFILDTHDSVGMVGRIRAAFSELGIPLDMSKEEGPSTDLVYIGYLLNTETMTVSLAPKSIIKVQPLLNEALGHSITITQLEKLIGKLEFMSKAVRLGRSHMYYLRNELHTAHAKNKSARQPMPDSMYYVNLHADSKAEVRWWQAAIERDTSSSMMCDLPWGQDIHPLHAYSDASEWGCGAYFDGSYISEAWSGEVIELTGINTDHRNMPLCEAIAVAVAVNTWRERFAGRHLLFMTDCIAVVHGVNKGRSSCTSSEWMNAIYKLINSICIDYNIVLRAQHIKGTDNMFADAVSRNQVDKFLATMASQQQNVSAAHVLPITVHSSCRKPSLCYPKPSSHPQHSHISQHTITT
jgi:hypothetical protein